MTRHPLTCCLLSAITMFASMSSYATGSAEFSNSAEPLAPNLLPEVPSGAFTLPPVAAPESPMQSTVQGIVRLRLEGVEFRGNTAIASSELEKIAAPYLGRELNDADLENLRVLVTRHYVDLGYVNSGAVLPPDAIHGNRLTFNIVEGRLSMVRMRGLERLADSYVVKRLVPDEEAVFNADALRERYQLLLEDPLFERLNARVIPGQSSGEAVLDIDATRAPAIHATLTVNNYRPVSIGETGATVAVGIRNLSGYGDLLDASLQYGTQTGIDARSMLGWRIPLNAMGTGFSFQAEHGQSFVLEQPLQTLDIGSILDSRDIGLSQVVKETLRHKFTVGINQVERENRTTLMGQPFSFTAGEPNGLTKVSTGRLWGEYSSRDESHVMVARITNSQSSNNLETVSGLPSGTPQVAHSYSAWLGQFQYVRQVMDNGAQLAARATLQSADQSMVSLDRMAIGGVSTVRGYRENMLIRDVGQIINLELHYPLTSELLRNAKWDLVPFYDRGEGRNAGESADVLSSVGLALNIASRGFALNIALAQRLQHPDALPESGALQDRGVHVQLSYAF